MTITSRLISVEIELTYIRKWMYIISGILLAELGVTFI